MYMNYSLNCFMSDCLLFSRISKLKTPDIYTLHKNKIHTHEQYTNRLTESFFRLIACFFFAGANMLQYVKTTISEKILKKKFYTLASTKKIPQQFSQFKQDFNFNLRSKGHSKWTTAVSGSVHHMIIVDCFNSPEELERYCGPHNFSIGAPPSS